jgi:hypothetical protein
MTQLIGPSVRVVWQRLVEVLGVWQPQTFLSAWCISAKSARPLRQGQRFERFVFVGINRGQIPIIMSP